LAAFTALHDINLQIRKGEFVCFLGPSGCGKTTLLRIIAGLEVQTRGEIFQAGRDISRLPPARRDYGIVFQSYALFPNLSVADNVAYGLVNRKMPRAEINQRVSELVKLVGLPGSEGKYPSQLSGGQQQRIALARALATRPGLLLLDEPLSALDALERVRLRSEIRALQQKLGVTTIMVTHDQEEALSVADRIVVMNHGVIEQVGTPHGSTANRPRPLWRTLWARSTCCPGACATACCEVGDIAHARVMDPTARCASTCAPKTCWPARLPMAMRMCLTPSSRRSSSWARTATCMWLRPRWRRTSSPCTCRSTSCPSNQCRWAPSSACAAA
jgi:ABC-type sulfate/molybdate transport systems ATPase subunit